MTRSTHRNSRAEGRRLDVLELDRRGHGVIAEMIRQRAYELSLRDDSGSAEDNWLRAEREIREELEAHAVDDDE